MRVTTISNLTLAASALLLSGCEAGVAPEAPVAAAAAGEPTVDPARWPAVDSAVKTDPEIEQQVADLLGRMSLEDKVGQVIQGEIQHVTPEDVRQYRLGSVLNGGGSHPGADKHSTIEDWVALADAYWEASMDTSGGGLPIPIVWGSDAVHGHNNVIGATLFPHNIGLGAAGNPQLIRRIGEVTATEVAVTGLDWTFGPTVAVPRDDRWGRTYEGYSEDPEIVRAYAGEVVKGLQGEAGSEGWLGPRKLLSTAKHFLGDGGTETGRDQGDNASSEAELRDIHAAGYTTALAAGVQTVMASFNSWHGRKMHGRRDLLTGVLKERMGVDGFVVGDWNGHGVVQRRRRHVHGDRGLAGAVRKHPGPGEGGRDLSAAARRRRAAHPAGQDAGRAVRARQAVEPAVGRQDRADRRYRASRGGAPGGARVAGAAQERRRSAAAGPRPPCAGGRRRRRRRR